MKLLGILIACLIAVGCGTESDSIVKSSEAIASDEIVKPENLVLQINNCVDTDMFLEIYISGSERYVRRYDPQTGSIVRKIYSFGIGGQGSNGGTMIGSPNLSLSLEEYDENLELSAQAGHFEIDLNEVGFFRKSYKGFLRMGGLGGVSIGERCSVPVMKLVRR